MIVEEAVRSQVAWPELDLLEAEVVLSDENELVLTGFERNGEPVVVSMRDLGEDVSAGFWDDEIERLKELDHPAAARVIDAWVEADRFFVLKVVRPPGVMIRARLLSGPLTSLEAATLLVAALELASALHALGLSASGTRLRSAFTELAEVGRPSHVITTYGLHVDNDIEMYNELREIALRVLSVVGGRYDKSTGLVLPVQALPVELETILRRAVGLAGEPFNNPSEMAAAVVLELGQTRPRGTPRSHVRTRPMVSASTPILGSDLLLAEEFLASLPPEPHDDD